MGGWRPGQVMGVQEESGVKGGQGTGGGDYGKLNLLSNYHTTWRLICSKNYRKIIIIITIINQSIRNR